MRREDAGGSGFSSVSAQIVRWNQQLAAAVAAASSSAADVHPTSSLLRHIRPPHSADVIDDVIRDVTACDV